MISYGQPTEEYFRTEALSASGIKLLLQSPAHYKYAPPFTSKSMDLGTAIHSAVLEPEEFEKIYVPYEGDGRLKATKDKIKEIKEKNQIPIKQSDYETVEGVLKSIESHDKASRLLDLPGHNEVSVLTEDKNKTALKGRIDRLTENTIIDLKTTQDASPNKFLKSIYTYKYYIQSYFYRLLMELETGKKYDFVFIAVETRAPYGVGVYDLSKGFDIMAATEYKTAYDRFNECRQTGIWNDYEDEIVTLRPYKK